MVLTLEIVLKTTRVPCSEPGGMMIKQSKDAGRF